MEKYRIKKVNDDWLILIPIIGWFVMFIGMIFGGWNNTYKIQKRFLFFFWKDIETVYGEKEAIYRCNELNGIHNHTSEFVYLWDKKYDRECNISRNNKTIIKVEYCPVCGEILSVKNTGKYAYKSSYQSIKKFKDICKIDNLMDISMVTYINNKNES